MNMRNIAATVTIFVFGNFFIFSSYNISLQMVEAYGTVTHYSIIFIKNWVNIITPIDFFMSDGERNSFCKMVSNCLKIYPWGTGVDQTYHVEYMVTI